MNLKYFITTNEPTELVNQIEVVTLSKKDCDFGSLIKVTKIKNLEKRVLSWKVEDNIICVIIKNGV